ncbi:MAG TPA: xanthine dehydrogenase family protein molybdopterin-binding subunit [Kofleriaceae bacterium]|nr:xanthine dehydrogenase family protein molybdopterin-binding subunit [Kofleriaceae bacterium]
MSLKEKLGMAIGGIVAKVAPDRPADPLIETRRAVGKPVVRVDGERKVRGGATFSADLALPRMCHAAVVFSTIARGKIVRIEARDAAAAPGVIAVMTHGNAPRMAPPPPFSMASGTCAASSLPPLGEEIFWNGQPVAVVIAEHREQAEAAAALVEVEYAEAPAALRFDAHKHEARPPSDLLGEPPALHHHNAERALRDAAVRVDHVYRTPRYNHNAIEPHVTVAHWTTERDLTLYDATQSLAWTRNTVATTFQVPSDGVRVIAPFVGGGFGGKGMLWSHTLLAAAAAKLVGRPVKLAMTREGVFRSVGGRTRTEQRVALGATAHGALQSLIHTGVSASVPHASFPEPYTFPARHLYAARAYDIAQKMLPLDTVANTAMRAPGEAVGTFALESALDELAYALGIDPIELRVRNEPERDPTSGHPFSSRNLVGAFRRGAAAFRWADRPPKPRAQRRGDWWHGQGVATATYPYMMMPCSARVRARADGQFVVQCAAHEMGMGTATVQRQHAADRLGVALERVDVEYGDSSLPACSTAGGSSQTVSIAAAVRVAIEHLHTALIQLAGPQSPLAGAKLDGVVARDGGLYRRDDGRGETYTAILGRAGKPELTAEGDMPQPRESLKYSMHSYGAQFCEVRVHAATGEVRIERWLGSFDVGRVINPRTAHSQLRGGIVMGIGMALSEETQLDERTGRIVNASLADYHVPVHLDIPEIEILCADIPDPHTPLGAHGIGEIGITGTAAAIANAVYHATGRRIRELPITLDKLL